MLVLYNCLSLTEVLPRWKLRMQVKTRVDNQTGQNRILRAAKEAREELARVVFTAEINRRLLRTKAQKSTIPRSRFQVLCALHVAALRFSSLPASATLSRAHELRPAHV